MSPEAVLSHPTVERVGWTLIHFLWQGTVLAAMFGVESVLLRKSKANLRYLAGCLTLALMMLAPCLTVFMVPVSESGFAAESDATVSMPPEVSKTDFAGSVELSVSEGSHPGPAPSRDVAPSPVTVGLGRPWKERAAALMEPALPYLVLGWLVGVFGLSVWHLGGWAQLQRLRRRMVRPVDQRLRSKLRELGESLGVHRAVALVESALVQVPTVVGWLKPVILLPATALTGLSPEQMHAILAHELAHIRRLDYLVNILQTAVEILGFYHPALWWVSHKIHVERENCCDDIAVAVTGDRVQYARALATLEEMRGTRPTLAVAAGGVGLLERIRRLVGTGSAEQARYSWLPAAITILLILAIAVPTTIALNAAQEKQQDVTDNAQKSSVGPAQDANSTEGDIRERFLNLALTKEGVTLKGKTVTWDEIVPLLGRVRDPRTTGLHLVASDDIGPEQLQDAKIHLSKLSHRLGLGYLSSLGNAPVEPNDSPREYFYAAPLEFAKDTSINQRAESGGFRQTYYRKGLEWANDPTGTHTERATVVISTIHFEKTLLGAQVTARLGVGCNSWPVSKFEVTVRLLDNKGKSLSEASCELGGDGTIISGEILASLANPTFSLGRWPDVSTAASFEISVAPKPDVPAEGGEADLEVEAKSATVEAPRVVGMSEEDAKVKIADGGKLKIGSISEELSDTAGAGIVLRQWPHGGMSVPMGSEVNLAVSSGGRRLGAVIRQLKEKWGVPEDGYLSQVRSANGTYVLFHDSRMDVEINDNGSFMWADWAALARDDGTLLWEKEMRLAPMPAIVIADGGTVALAELQQGPGGDYKAILRFIDSRGQMLGAYDMGTHGYKGTSHWFIYNGSSMPGLFSSDEQRFYLAVMDNWQQHLVCLNRQGEVLWAAPFLAQKDAGWVWHGGAEKVLYADGEYLLAVEHDHDARPTKRYVVFTTAGQKLLKGRAPTGSSVRLQAGDIVISHPKGAEISRQSLDGLETKRADGTVRAVEVEVSEVAKVIRLKYADPEDLSERLNASFSEPHGIPGARLDEMGNLVPMVRFIPDPRSKAILVLCPPELLGSVEQMIKELDRPVKPLGRAAEYMQMFTGDAVGPDDEPVGYVDNSAEGKRSLGGSGHAVMFERPPAYRYRDIPRYVEAVEIFAARYGTPTPPEEDFHLYILDEEQNMLADVPYPYAMIERGQLRWYTLTTPSIEVPEDRFYIALSFNPHRTKGVYLGFDESVEESHSYTGLPGKGFEKVEQSYDWMVRVHMSGEPSGDKAIKRVDGKTAKQRIAAPLPNGVTVELIGLYHGETIKDLVFWKPDGSLFSDSEIQKYRERVALPKWQNKDFRFEYGLMTRFSPLDELNTEMFVKQGRRMSTKSPGSDGIAIALVASDPHEREEGFSKVANIKAAAAYGEWDTRKWSAGINDPSVLFLDEHSNIMLSPPRRTGERVGGSGYGGYGRSSPRRKTDERVLDVTVNAGNIDFDCFYELKDGSIHQAEWRETLGQPNWIGPDQRTPMICKRYALSHKPEEITEYIVKYRRFEIVEFKNVSLKPGFKTHVEVVVGHAAPHISSEPRPQERPLSRKEIRAKLENLENRRTAIQRDLDAVERAIEDVRARWGFGDLEERSYPHPVTARLMRLEQERDDCLVEIAQLKARIGTIEKQADSPQQKDNLKKAGEDLAVLGDKLDQLQKMCDEAAAKKRELDMARVQYRQRASVRDERKRMLDSIKEQIEKLKILHDDPATPQVRDRGGGRQDESIAEKGR